MRVVAKFVAGIALALGLSSAASASTVTLLFPTVDPAVYEKSHGRCSSGCEDTYHFTLHDAVNTTLLVELLEGSFRHYDWTLQGDDAGVIAEGGGGDREHPITAPATLIDIGPLLLFPDVYCLDITLYKGSGTYRVTLSDPPAVPIPGAALLFASGLGALGFSRCNWRKKGGSKTTTSKA